MTPRTIAVVLLLATTGLSGCMQFEEVLGRISAPDADLAVTPLQEGQVNTQDTFVLQATHDEPVAVRIEATADDGRTRTGETPASDADVTADGTFRTEASVELPDGTWTLVLYLDGHRVRTLDDVTIDATPPAIQGLEAEGDAEDGAYTLGMGASAEPGAQVTVRRQPAGELVATALPVRLSGLGDGIHVYEVAIQDEAGNRNTYTVQVRAGAAKFLPEGQFAAGIVARYSNELRIWDLEDKDAYLERSAARSSVGAGYVGPGYQIDPEDPQVQEVVQETVTPDMNSVEAALALYEWMFDELEYDVGRLDQSDLLSPAQTLDNGGGVCRDLAALYTSLLRAAGVPARVVTGYLGGDVDGFHAWVEFYGGPVDGNPSPWVAVDVSGIGLSDVEGDDLYNPQAMLQSFAIQRPDYLTLRNLPPSAEVDGWATAVSVSYPEDGDVAFAKDVPATHYSADERSLCVDFDRHARQVGPASGGCEEYSHYLQDFPVHVQQVLDYGLEVEDRGGNGDVTLTLAYPFEADQPGTVEFAAYGPTERDEDWDSGAGRVALTF